MYDNFVDYVSNLLIGHDNHKILPLKSNRTPLIIEMHLYILKALSSFDLYYISQFTIFYKYLYHTYF